MKAIYTAAALLAGTALLAALAVAQSFSAFGKVTETADARKQTYEVMHLAEVLLSALKDAETGQRGYSLTGDTGFLEPYTAVRDRLSGQLEELRTKTLSTAAHRHLDALVPLFSAQLAELSHAIDLRRNGGPTPVQDAVVSDQGKRLMDSIRAEMAGFITIEKDELAQRDAAFQTQMRRLFAIIVAASLIALLCALLFAFLVFREVRHRMTHMRHLETQHVLQIQEEMNLQLRRANLTLQISEDKLAVTLGSIGDAVIATDTEGRVTLLNPVAEHLTGWTQQEAVNRPVDEIFHIISQDTRQPAIVPVKGTLAQGTIQGLANHTVLIARDGSERAIADSCAPIRDDNGKVVGAVLVFRDVTEEYAAQQSLRDNAALIQTVLDTVADGIITLQANGAVIETANASAERLFGYAAAELIGQELSLLIPELDRCRREMFPESRSPGGPAGVVGPGREVLGRRKDGAVFPLEMAASEMWLGGRRHFTGVFRDISARIQAEEALVKAGALQNAIVNSENFSSIATDEKGVIQLFNVGAERMLGYAAADVLDRITPADISDPQEVVARAGALSVELGTPITPGFEALVFKASRGIEDIYELTYIRKDGSRFPAVVSVTALRDAHGVIIGYLLIGTDNTARKQAEEALLKAGALQSAIFNSANFSSIATDAKGVIQIFNVGAERMLGYRSVEVMNKITPADISDPQEVIIRAEALSVELGTPITPGFEALVFKASRGIEDIYELTYIRKDGSRFPAVVSVTALRDDHSVIIGYLLIGTDNTARKQLAQRLRDLQFYTRSLFESNIDALMTTDPLGIITDVNRQMELLADCPREELIGAPFKSYFTDPERAETSIKLVLSQKKVTNYELTARSRGGKETVVSYNATTLFDQEGTLQGVFAAARDVTELKRFEQTLQEKNLELESAKTVAEKANLAKSDFLSSMSHELRSPLNAILGFAQLMESESQPPTATQQESIAQILKAGWHLLKLIDEVLDLAKIESRQIPMSQEPVLLAEVMLECRSMLEPQAQQRGITITLLPSEAPYHVKADRTRLKQVIINLFSNAVKYNSEQGAVEVACAVSSPGRVRVSVKDTGAGLSPEGLQQLFQPFNRLGQESGVEEGTGIGLVVAKRLTELMGGTIGVESTVGVGSVFWFELDSADVQEMPLERVEPMEVAAYGSQVRTLLYIEDNPANMKLVEYLVARRPDIGLLTADTGTGGVALARSCRPAAILMDINLPDITGYEALKILRADPATCHIPVVALSANAMPSDTEKGFHAGFFRYITKPIKIKEFMDTLNAVMEFAEEGESRRADPGHRP